MRLAGIAQRVALADLELQNPAPHEIEQGEAVSKVLRCSAVDRLFLLVRRYGAFRTISRKNQ
jgi:hypothetical protein